MIQGAGEGEEEVGETVEVDDRSRAHRLGVREGDDRPLGAPTDGAGDVDGGSGGSAPGQDERSKRREIGREPVDRFLEPKSVFRLEEADDRGGLPAVGAREVGSEREQIGLRASEQRIEMAVELRGTDRAEVAVQLVDRAIGIDARVVFGDAAASEQPRGPVVARLRVDLHRFQLRRP